MNENWIVALLSAALVILWMDGTFWKFPVLTYSFFQLPGCEFDFGDPNPCLQGLACWEIFKKTNNLPFLEAVFPSLRQSLFWYVPCALRNSELLRHKTAVCSLKFTRTSLRALPRVNKVSPKFTWRLDPNSENVLSYLRSFENLHVSRIFNFLNSYFLWKKGHE